MPHVCVQKYCVFDPVLKFYSYQTMPIDNISFRARVGIFNGGSFIIYPQIPLSYLLLSPFFFIIGWTIATTPPLISIVLRLTSLIYHLLWFITLLRCHMTITSGRSLATPTMPFFHTSMLLLDCSNFFISTFSHILLLLGGDIEIQPGPTNAPRTKSIFIIHNNVQGLGINNRSDHSKFDILIPQVRNYDIICLTETHLSTTVSNNRCFVQGFQDMFRSDRPDGYGGVGVLVSNDLPCKRRTDLELAGMESVWLEISSANGKFLLATFYRPPSSPVGTWETITTSIELAKESSQNIICVGDTNDNLLVPNSHLSKSYQTFEHRNFTQLIKEPTRITPTSATLIDPIYVTCPDLVQASGVHLPFCSDHHATFLELRFTFIKDKFFTRTIWNYDLADFQAYRNGLMLVNWDEMFDNNDIHLASSLITDKILSTARQHIPNKIIKMRPDDPPWLDEDIRNMIRQRDNKHRIAKTQNTADAWMSYRQCRNKLLMDIKTAKEVHYQRLASKLQDPTQVKPRLWWKILSSFYKSTSSNASQYPPLLVNGSIIADNRLKADAFNNFFSSVCNVDFPNAQLPLPTIPDLQLTELNITAELIKKVIKGLNPSKASGPDEVSPRLLREGAEALSLPLHRLFNSSLTLHIFPDPWKLASVTPIHKKDQKDLTNNYRPISLLSCIGKCFERCVFNIVFEFLVDNNLITMLQSGFIPGDSTTNQLLYLYDSFSKALDDGKEVRIVFCDISKAFDRVWHKGVLFKLQQMGINGGLLEWFKSYLTNRKQKVVIRGQSSEEVSINAGVPQGSILGPLLFIIFINDIITDIRSPMRLFADDTSVYVIVDNPVESAITLNDDLTRIENWANRWQVMFSPKKTECMTISRLRTRAAIHPNLYLFGELVKEVPEHKHLGLTFTKDLTWHSHINEIIEKATRRIDILRGLKNKLDRRSLQTIYFSFIRPILEYSSIVFCNITDYDSDKLESIQLDAARIVTGARRGTSHAFIYLETGWELLSLRRTRQRLCLMYKFVNKLAPSYLYNLLPPRVMALTPYNLRNRNTFREPPFNTTAHGNSFFPHTVREWNNLDQSITSAATLLQFKSKLKGRRTSKPYYYFTGLRKMQILHAQLRLGCSTLNQHLVDNHLADDRSCHCGHPTESPEHFLLYCPLFDNERFITISNLNTRSINTLLFGDETLTPQYNNQIFNVVQLFIRTTDHLKL